MASIINKLQSENLIASPKFLKNNIHYEVIMGSMAYGCNSANSDMDLYAVCMPLREVIFPHEY